MARGLSYQPNYRRIAVLWGSLTLLAAAISIGTSIGVRNDARIPTGERHADIAATVSVPILAAFSAAIVIDYMLWRRAQPLAIKTLNRGESTTLPLLAGGQAGVGESKEGDDVGTTAGAAPASVPVPVPAPSGVAAAAEVADGPAHAGAVSVSIAFGGTQGPTPGAEGALAAP